MSSSFVLVTFHWAPSGAKTAEDQAGADVEDIRNRILEDITLKLRHERDKLGEERREE